MPLSLLRPALPVLGLLILVVSACEVEPVQPIGDLDQTIEPATVVGEPGLPLLLPTRNDARDRGDEAAFYMGVDKDTITGLRTAAWEAGRYGFVRDVIRTPVGRTFNRLHEGVDIAPVARDDSGEPLDSVQAVFDGTVAYAFNSTASAFGRHVVLEHDWGDGPVYSFYAHMNEVLVSKGDSVASGDAIGRLGYTGKFINRRRAHVHFEMDLLLNGDITAWLKRHGTRVPHGKFFGTNLAGLDPTALLDAAQAPDFDFVEYVTNRPVAYRLAVPGDRPLDLLNRYPWMRSDRVPTDTTDVQGGTGSWEVSFTQAGVPVQARRIPREVTGPTVTYVSSEVRQGHLSTNRMLLRRGDRYEPSARGKRYFGLLTTTPDSAPW